jgi:hypothetical protein
MFLLRPIMIVGAMLRIAYFFVLYLLRPSARSIAETRIQAFWKVIQLSLSPRPYNLPMDIQMMQAVAGKHHG